MYYLSPMAKDMPHALACGEVAAFSGKFPIERFAEKVSSEKHMLFAYNQERFNLLYTYQIQLQH